MQYFIIASTVILVLMALIWTREDYPNFAIKSIFTGMAVWGLFLASEMFGYIVRV